MDIGALVPAQHSNHVDCLARYLELTRLTRVSSRFWDEHGERWFHSADPNCWPDSWKEHLDEFRANYPCLEVETMDLISRAQSHNIVDVESAVFAFLGSRKIKLEKLVGVLGTIGANAPFIGLLGTVLGIVRAFNQMSIQGLGSGIQNISGGIAEALVATAIGLLVAVPAVVSFNLLHKQIAVLIQRAENLSALILSAREQVA